MRPRPAPAIEGATVRCAGVVHVYEVAGTDIAALRGVDLSVDPGERVALLGPSGSGKSTLLSIIAGLRRPSAGFVVLDGADISRCSEAQVHDYRGRAVGLILQSAADNLLPYANPAENVRYALAGLRGTSQASSPGATVLDLVGLRSERRPVAQLDRAAQQAVALAVAVARRPRMLLADEPTSQLDGAARDQLLDVLVEIAEAAGTTVIVVTHDEHVASRMQRMVRMREGRVGSEGRRKRQLTIIGVDGSLLLPEDLMAAWPAGSAVEVVPTPAGTLEIRHPTSGDAR
ncbi:ABC transporter ATP-binding protein [uncultured Friedmanniella sp.]|uniref:ABC transporter ATP-binding protein n=1 Tax=uncultured Friedmanniella sp. TaxID=335381 RepID=UPI0035CC0F10